jgi:zinc transport system substrate-binding protein
MTSGSWTPGGAGRRSVARRTALFYTACLVFGCAAGTAWASDAKVVVTIKPIHSLVARLMEGFGEPTLLVDGSASPHSFALKPSQVRAIDAADIFIRVSERLEPFTGKIVRAMPQSVRLVTLIDAPGLVLLDQRQGGAFEAHADHDASQASDTGEEGKNAHIWLDPVNAKVAAAYLAGVLSARYPEHADLIKSNAARLQSDIDALAGELERATEPLRGRPFVVFHDAYQYFDTRFGLDAVGSITVSPEVQPSAKRINELRTRIRELNAACVFAEPLFQSALVAAVAEGTGARAGTLDPEGLALKAGPQLYFTLMRNLASSLKACLTPDT